MLLWRWACSPVSQDPEPPSQFVVQLDCRCPQPNRHGDECRSKRALAVMLVLVVLGRAADGVT